MINWAICLFLIFPQIVIAPPGKNDNLVPELERTVTTSDLTDDCDIDAKISEIWKRPIITNSRIEQKQNDYLNLENVLRLMKKFPVEFENFIKYLIEKEKNEGNEVNSSNAFLISPIDGNGKMEETVMDQKSEEFANINKNSPSSSTSLKTRKTVSNNVGSEKIIGRGGLANTNRNILSNNASNGRISPLPSIKSPVRSSMAAKKSMRPTINNASQPKLAPRKEAEMSPKTKVASPTKTASSRIRNRP